MGSLHIDELSRVIINPYAIDNYATRIFISYYNKTGFAYRAYPARQNTCNVTCAVKSSNGTYLLNSFNKDYCAYENQISLDGLSLKDRLTKFQSLKYIDDSQWFII